MLYDTAMGADDATLGRIETEITLLMRLGEASRRSTGLKPTARHWEDHVTSV